MTPKIIGHINFIDSNYIITCTDGSAIRDIISGVVYWTNVGSDDDDDEPVYDSAGFTEADR